MWCNDGTICYVAVQFVMQWRYNMLCSGTIYDTNNTIQYVMQNGAICDANGKICNTIRTLSQSPYWEWYAMWWNAKASFSIKHRQRFHLTGFYSQRRLQAKWPKKRSQLKWKFLTFSWKTWKRRESNWKKCLEKTWS